MLQSFLLDILLLLQSFPSSFVSRVLFPFIFPSFFLFYSNILCHISCRPIHIAFLLQIFQGTFLSNIHFFLCSFPVFLFSFFPFHTLFQILLPIPLHSLSFLFLLMYHFLPWSPFIIPGICPSLVSSFYLILFLLPTPLLLWWSLVLVLLLFVLVLDLSTSLFYWY